MGRDSSVGTTTRRAGRSGDPIPVGTRFSATVQTGYGIQVSFPGVKRPGRAANHSPPPSAEVKERAEPCLYSSSGHSWPVLRRILPFTISLITTLVYGMDNRRNRVRLPGRHRLFYSLRLLYDLCGLPTHM